MPAVQFDVEVRNAVANAVETLIGPSPVLEIRTGPAPAHCTDADSGTLLAPIPVPSDWLTGAASGVKSKQGTWSVAAVAAGDQGHFRLKDSGSTVRAQGAITLAGGGGPMIANSLTLALGQFVSVTAFTVTAGNA